MALPFMNDDSDDPGKLITESLRILFPPPSVVGFPSYFTVPNDTELLRQILLNQVAILKLLTAP